MRVQTKPDQQKTALRRICPASSDPLLSSLWVLYFHCPHLTQVPRSTAAIQSLQHVLEKQGFLATFFLNASWKTKLSHTCVVIAVERQYPQNSSLLMMRVVVFRVIVSSMSQQWVQYKASTPACGVVAAKAMDTTYYGFLAGRRTSLHRLGTSRESYSSLSKHMANNTTLAWVHRCFITR